jgi:hypothetical protein
MCLFITDVKRTFIIKYLFVTDVKRTFIRMSEGNG